MRNKAISILTLLLIGTTPAWAQPKPNELESFFSNPLLIILGGIALVLLFVIYILGKVALMAIKKGGEQKKEKGNKMAAIGTIILTLASHSVFALSNAPNRTSGFNASITQEALWASLTAIFIEIVIIAYLYNIIRRFSGMRSAKKTSEKWAKIWASWQKSTPIENEGDIDLGHNYDGIRELDNPTPPWWRWAFVGTMLFGVVYMYRYHIAKTAPLQIEELEIAMAKGEADKKAYLATAKNAIDESNVVMLEGIDLSTGAMVFQKNCVACHGPAGGGNSIGPNLTDAYWLHGGSVVDVFKTVKYGWPEKGMQAWQDVLSSYEMAQVTSYVKSIAGSNPAGAKDPQGEIWKEEAVDQTMDKEDTEIEKAANKEDAEQTDS